MSANEGFFTIDRRVWPDVCALGLNPAVAYLVLARGVDGKNRERTGVSVTTWAVQAIENYTGISRQRARDAVDQLIAAGFVRVAVPGVKPRHKLLPPWEIRGRREFREPLTERQAALLTRIEAGQPLTRADRGVVARLRLSGWASQERPGAPWVAHRPAAEWVWLPNTLIDGAADEDSPVERVRQCQDVMTLRLLVDAYDAQHLRNDGGINRALIRDEYERIKVGESGGHVVWGFRRLHRTMSWSSAFTTCHRRDKLTVEEKANGENPGVDFFRRFGTLERLGIVEMVTHLIESPDATAEPLHPFSNVAGSVEASIYSAAADAAKTLITDGQATFAYTERLWTLPVPAHMDRVAVVGVARLRYRPHTKVARAWHAQMLDVASKYIAKYQRLKPVAA